MSSIFIEGVILRGKHGVHESERTFEQDFLIDIRAEVDTSDAAASDSLEDTVDYVFFLDIAKDVVENQSFYLVEKLADTIADGILTHPRVAQVIVSVRKPTALKNGVPGISTTKSRS
jgi:dihydroneopterin aldolase